MILADLMQAHREAAAARAVAQVSLEHASRLKRGADIDRLLTACDAAVRAEETAEQAFLAGAAMNECERCGSLQAEMLANVSVHARRSGFSSLQLVTVHVCDYCAGCDLASELDWSHQACAAGCACPSWNGAGD